MLQYFTIQASLSFNQFDDPLTAYVLPTDEKMIFDSLLPNKSTIRRVRQLINSTIVPPIIASDDPPPPTTIDDIRSRPDTATTTPPSPPPSPPPASSRYHHHQHPDGVVVIDLIRHPAARRSHSTSSLPNNHPTTDTTSDPGVHNNTNNCRRAIRRDVRLSQIIDLLRCRFAAERHVDRMSRMRRIADLGYHRTGRLLYKVHERSAHRRVAKALVKYARSNQAYWRGLERAVVLGDVTAAAESEAESTTWTGVLVQQHRREVQIIRKDLQCLEREDGLIL